MASRQQSNGGGAIIAPCCTPRVAQIRGVLHRRLVMWSFICRRTSAVRVASEARIWFRGWTFFLSDSAQPLDHALINPVLHGAFFLCEHDGVNIRTCEIRCDFYICLWMLTAVFAFPIRVVAEVSTSVAGESFCAPKEINILPFAHVIYDRTLRLNRDAHLARCRSVRSTPQELAFAREIWPGQTIGNLPQLRKLIALPHERRRRTELPGKLALCSTGYIRRDQRYAPASFPHGGNRARPNEASQTVPDIFAFRSIYRPSALWRGDGVPSWRAANSKRTKQHK